MKRFIAPFLTLASLSVLLVFAANIKTDYSHSVDFSVYRTYSWIQIKADPLWVDRITGVVDHELNTKGWAKVAESGTQAWRRSAPHTKCQPWKLFIQVLAVAGAGGAELPTVSPLRLSRRHRSEP